MTKKLIILEAKVKSINFFLADPYHDDTSKILIRISKVRTQFLSFQTMKMHLKTNVWSCFYCR